MQEFNRYHKNKHKLFIWTDQKKDVQNVLHNKVLLLAYVQLGTSTVTKYNTTKTQKFSSLDRNTSKGEAKMYETLENKT